MKTIVTGGAGFIGSNLVQELVRQGRGNEVIVLDNLSRGSIGNLPNGIEVREVDLSDYQQAVGYFRGATTVFHLAARIGNENFLHGALRNELDTLGANLAIDNTVIRCCVEVGVETVVYASSSAVYPISLQNKIDAVLSEEDYTGIDAEGGYGGAKLIGEVQAEWLTIPTITKASTRVGIARIFNAYGRYSDTTIAPHAVTKFIIEALNGKGLPITGDGSQTRDYVFVSDCIDALLQLEKEASNPPVIVNVGSGKPISILGLARLINELVGSSLPIRYSPATGGPLSRTANIQKASSVLGWKPTVDLRDGLIETIEWLSKE